MHQTHPLAPQQQRLCFLDDLDPGQPIYNVVDAYRVTGDLDVPALHRALDDIVARHEPLRTVVLKDRGEALGRVLDEWAFELPMTDLSAFDPDSRARLAAEVLDAAASRPFALDRDLMFRAELVRLGPTEHLIAFTTHHIATDGWSLSVINQELKELYAAHRLGIEPRLETLSVSYQDYVEWQLERLESRSSDRDLDYWRAQLTGSSPLLHLPVDRPRPSLQRHRGAQVRGSCPMSVTAELRRFAAAQRCTLFQLLLAALFVLLHRYTGQSDIVIGTANSAREKVVFEKLIGFFANTLVLRCDLSGNPPWESFLKSVVALTWDALEHQDFPFDKVVDVLQPERTLSHNPLFQVLFVMPGTSGGQLELQDLELTSVPTHNGASKFDLSWFIHDLGDNLEVNLEYDTDLFDRQTVERMVNHLLRLLAGIVQEPGQRIGHLPLLTEQERETVLVGWNDTVCEYPSESTVDRLFDAQASQTPDAVAVVHRGHEFSYREVLSRADRLSSVLQAQGVSPGEIVGICLDRSVDTITSVLGVLKAGGAYLALDPAYPSSRLAAMVEDAKPRVVIVHQRHASLIVDQSTERLYLDTFDWSQSAPRSRDDDNPTAAPDDAAYVLYTSGSTGKPKGVVMPHRALVNLVAWHQRHPRLGQPARTLQFAPLSFDVSFQDIMTTLCTGGTLVMIDDEMRRDPSALLDVMADGAIQRAFLPVAVLQQLAEVCCRSPRSLECPSDLISAGESLRLTSEIRGWMKQLPGCRLHNHYGPTESHVVTAETLDADPETWPTEAPIGHPLSNVRILLLDANLQPVPVGVEGEIYIGGDALASGYLGRPELTRQQFIDDPFSDDPAGRLYASGDKARYLGDGRIQCLGRLDQQLNVRGYRIEPGDIETTLLAHPNIQNAAVAVHGDNAAGEARLVAYLVARGGSGLTSREARSFLRERLPDFMIPSLFVNLDAMPLTTSGKLDRASLPAIEVQSTVDETALGAPTSDTEQLLAQIWQDVLGTSQIGVYDDFFDIGGHSLDAMRIVNQVNETFPVSLAIRQFFENATVASMAKWIDTRSASTRGAPTAAHT